MAKEYKMTRAILKEYEEELYKRKTLKRKEIAEQISVARGFGDLSENSEYEAAKEEQRKNEDKISELEDILNHAVLIEETDDDSAGITLGYRVTVRDVEYDETMSYTIYGTQQANPGDGIISDESPLGKALLGKAPGMFVDVEAPGGTIRYEILSAEREGKNEEKDA